MTEQTYTYDPLRLERLEAKHQNQMSDLDGDHMTDMELDEMSWQQDTKAIAIAANNRREAAKSLKKTNSGELPKAPTVIGVGEKLAELRATRWSNRNDPALPHSSVSSGSLTGLDRIKFALAKN